MCRKCISISLATGETRIRNPEPGICNPSSPRFPKSGSEKSQRWWGDTTSWTGTSAGNALKPASRALSPAQANRPPTPSPPSNPATTAAKTTSFSNPSFAARPTPEYRTTTPASSSTTAPTACARLPSYWATLTVLPSLISPTRKTSP